MAFAQTRWRRRRFAPPRTSRAMGEGARYIEREEVAAVVTFLCSDAASAITGELLPLVMTLAAKRRLHAANGASRSLARGVPAVSPERHDRRQRDLVHDRRRRTVARAGQSRRSTARNVRPGRLRRAHAALSRSERAVRRRDLVHAARVSSLDGSAGGRPDLRAASRARSRGSSDTVLQSEQSYFDSASSAVDRRELHACSAQ